MSNGAYSPSKILAHPDRLADLRDGRTPYPVHLHLIISDLCDLGCPLCAYRLSGYSSNQMFGVIDPVTQAVNNNPNRRLPIELIKAILDDCKAMGTQAVEFTGGGEPTIHPQAPEALRYAQDLGLETALITNGLHIGRMLPEALQTKWLRFSIDAATAETYAKVRPSHAGPDSHISRRNFDLALAGAAQAVESRESADCVIGLGFVVQKDNWHELYHFVKMARDLGADNVRISGAFTPEGNGYHEEYVTDAMELERAAARDFNSARFHVHGRFSEKVEDLAAAPDYKTCWYQNLTTYIGGDGNLYRCCVTSYNTHGLLGNLTEHGGFKALWDSKVTQLLLKQFDARSCTRCQFNDRNREIDKAVKSEEQLAAPTDIIHKNFI